MITHDIFEQFNLPPEVAEVFKKTYPNGLPDWTREAQIDAIKTNFRQWIGLAWRSGAIPKWSMYKADLAGIDLSWADLSKTDMVGANLAGADLLLANLAGADLGWANLERARLVQANLRCANLAKANLRGADLRGADLTGADLQGADLSGAYLEDTYSELSRMYHNKTTTATGGEATQ